MAVRFFDHAARQSDVIALILPQIFFDRQLLMVSSEKRPYAAILERIKR